MSRPILSVDTETATLHGPPHLLELGAVRAVDGEIVDHFESFVCPEIEIDPGATAIHGISAEDVRSAPVVAEVLEAFRDWAGDDWLVAHNASFDAHVLGFEYARAGIDPPPGAMYCSLKLARKRVPDSPDHKLPTLADHLEIEVDALHRALADAVTCWKVVEACLADGGELLRDGGPPTSIAGNGPARPRRFPQRLRKLDAACRDRASVTLLYGGDADSAPARLPVRPRLCYQGRDHAYLEAECELSGILKTYRLDRIQRVLVESAKRVR